MTAKPAAVVEPMKIDSKPKPPYTSSAREEGVDGVVRLRVTFLASGQIGSISVVSGLPFGLTDQAVAAAQKIKFKPKKVNGVPVSVVRLVEYSFSIYYREDDPEIATKANILKMPKPDLSETNVERKKVLLEIVLGSNGIASVLDFKSKVSEDIKKKISEAVSRISLSRLHLKMGGV